MRKRWRPSAWEIEAMTIRRGANPIGWSNDDLQEIGGDTPLETCLAEAKEVILEAEQDLKKAPALPYANKGVAHLREAFRESGLV
jgi:hypothetical protein